ncbi:hypothetical protein AAF712_016186 [Marasmius tenuissimus]|uniref:Uncharacterized protein n=1 Tax=Marasmius tenuissimus TaxID=585030 RepID=A0ABR2Z8L2_9AGAR
MRLDHYSAIAFCVVGCARASFSLSGLQLSVAVNQDIPVTWTRQPGDPKTFVILHTPFDLASIAPEDFNRVVLAQDSDTSGRKRLQFHDAGKTVTVAVYDIAGKKLVDWFQHVDKPYVPYLWVESTPFYTYPTPITVGGSEGPQTVATTPPVDSNSPPHPPTNSLQPTSTTTTQSRTVTCSSITSASQIVTAQTLSAGTTNTEHGEMGKGGICSATEPRTQSVLPSTSTGPGSAHPSINPTQTRQSNIGMILGVVLGALALVLLTLLAIFCYRRRNKNSQDKLCKPARRLTTFFRDKMINRLDNQSRKEERILPDPQDTDQGRLATSVFASTTMHREDTDRMSSVNSFTSDIPVSMAHTYFTSESGSDITTAITPEISEDPKNIEGRYGARARTDRQMEIEEKIFELQREVIQLRAAGDTTTDILELRDRIESLRQLQGEKWAMELSDEVPREMAH